MGGHAKQNNTPSAAADEAGAGERNQAAGRDRRAVRTVDLTDEDIAAIEASEMAPRFEHLNAEVDDVRVRPESIRGRGAGSHCGFSRRSEARQA